jgi:hypothetical protein
VWRGLADGRKDLPGGWRWRLPLSSTHTALAQSHYISASIS